MVGILWVSLGVFLPLVFYFLSAFHQTKWSVVGSANAPFECGMETLSEERVNLHLHFFLISILFVVFDLEVAAILPLALSPSSGQSFSFVWYVVFFCLVLGVGVELEMNSLDWKE
nr:NADH dehydrogenase subunit 3 [Quadraceps punctatus]